MQQTPLTTRTRLGIASPGASSGRPDAKSILARLDRLDVWSMPFWFVGIIGLGFLFTFYDVFDINVSFIQSCVALKPGCTPANALSAIRVPIALNLAGYVVGTLLLSPLSDKIGRRNMLLVTMLLTGIGSLWNALAPGLHQLHPGPRGHRHGGGRRPVDRQHLRGRGGAAP